MKILISGVVWIASLIFIGSCGLSPCAAAPVSQAAFETNIAAIDKWIVDLTSELDLLENKDFVAIYKSPTAYYGNVIALLAKPKIKESQKAISVFAMHRLPRKEYLAFLDILLDMLQRKKISYMLFEAGVFPSHDWNTTLQENYEDPEIKAYLFKVKASTTVTQEGRNYADKILSGQAARAVEAWRDREQNINPKYLKDIQK